MDLSVSLSSIPIDPPPPIPPPPIIPAVAPIVANPPATVAGLPPSFNHPTYSDMICEAIGALKEKNGSSKRAIAKYIELAHKDLPPTHDDLLTHHLKRLKNNGVLVMVKKSYKLASSARSEASVPDSAPNNPPDVSPPGPKRGRGRPPKPKPAVSTADPNSQQQSVPAAGGLKRPPGRPKKNGSIGQLGARSGRGRPPKSAGRQRKPKTVRSVVGANGTKRGRGRPPKALNQLAPQGVMPIQGQAMAVPYADATADTATATATVAVPNLPRPRGRPKATAGAAGIVVPGKRRGRPPKVGGVTAKPIEPKKTTGRPVGRPKKTTDGADSKALAAAHGDLKRKLEFFQSKVKQAIEVLKPQLSRESNISIIDAIQELEALAAMDISTTYNEDAQPSSSPPPPIQPPVLQNEGQVH